VNGSILPGLPLPPSQIDEHDDAELGGDTGERDEADGDGDRKVVAQQIDQPDPTDQREGSEIITSHASAARRKIR